MADDAPARTDLDEAERPNFEGHTVRECGEHRTVGYRAWCHDCGEWCYPNPQMACLGCEVPALRAALVELNWAEMLTEQTCGRGEHATWYVDSEHHHACPWCALADAQDEIARLRHELDQADHFGRGEFRVTTWAYEQVTRLMNEAKAENDRLKRIEAAAQALLSADEVETKDPDGPLTLFDTAFDQLRALVEAPGDLDHNPGEEEMYGTLEPSDRVLDDGFGSTWVKCDLPDCQLQIVRPGKVQCDWCDE